MTDKKVTPEMLKAQCKRIQSVLINISRNKPVCDSDRVMMTLMGLVDNTGAGCRISELGFSVLSLDENGDPK